jgi:hypothetical protein
VPTSGEQSSNFWLERLQFETPVFELSIFLKILLQRKFLQSSLKA